MKNSKYIIFGASYAGEYAYKVLKDNYNICFFADNNDSKWDKDFCGLKILPARELINYVDYKIIIASVYYDQISTQLFLMGLEDLYVFLSRSSKSGHKNDYSIEKVKHFKDLKNLRVVKGEDISFKNDYTSAFIEKDVKYINTDVKYGKKNVLFFAYIFPPIGGSGVQRSVKFVKHLKKLGYNPIVVTVGKSFCKSFFNSSLDYTLNNDIPEDVSVLRFDDDYFSTEKLSTAQLQEIINIISGSVQNFDIMKKYLEAIKENSYSNRRFILRPDKYIGWAISVLKNIENIIDFNKIDIMFSTSHPYSDHLIPFYIKQKTGIPWVSDLRDEWTNNPLAVYECEVLLDLTRAMESNILNYSNMNICVAPSIILNYIDSFNLHDKKMVCIENGYDDDDFIDLNTENLKPDKFTIIHNGVFCENFREPISFLQSLNELIEENKIDKNRLSVEFVGDNSDSIKVKIEQHDIFKVVKIKPYMNHIESLKNLTKAHLLLLILGSENTKASYTGKIFEYLRMKKKILALAPMDSDASKLLEKAKSGESCEIDDIANIKQYILKCYNDYINGIVYDDFDQDVIKQFSRELLTKKLVDIFESLISKK